VGLILLGGFHAVLDVPNKNGWAGPLVALGRNTLVVVIGVSTLGRSLAFLRFLSPTIRKVCPDTASSAFYGIVIVLVVGGAAIWLDRRNTYLTA
jgi:predicted acyltransferase